MVALVLSAVVAATGPAHDEPIECGDLVFALSRNGAEPGQRADAGELRLPASGRRTLVRRTPWDEQRYLVEPTAEGETSFAVAADGRRDPVMFVDLDRDERGRLRREVLRRPRLPYESDVVTDIMGWFEYRRGPGGRLAELIYYDSVSADLHWMTGDDLVGARVFFHYDAEGALTDAAVARGWARDGLLEAPALIDRLTFLRNQRGQWLGTASQLGRRADLAHPCGGLIPERAATLLATPTLAPWVSWISRRRGRSLNWSR